MSEPPVELIRALRRAALYRTNHPHKLWPYQRSMIVLADRVTELDELLKVVLNEINGRGVSEETAQAIELVVLKKRSAGAAARDRSP